MVTAHPMHSRPRRRRGGTEVYELIRSSVQAPGWPGKELRQFRSATRDIASDEIRIALFQFRRVERGARQNYSAKSGRKPFDLRLNARGHVFGASVRDVAIGPG